MANKHQSKSQHPQKKQKKRQVPEYLLPDVKRVNITAYDEDTYYKIFPTATEEDYEDIADLEVAPLTLIQNTEKQIHAKIQSIRFVVIDNNYFDWLEQTGRIEEHKSRLEYMNTISDEDAERLWYESGRDQMVYVGFIPVVFMNDNPFFSFPNVIDIPSITTKKLREIISQATRFTLKDVSIMPKMYALDDIVNNEEIVTNILEDSFRKQSIFQHQYEKIMITKKDKQRVNLYVRTISIGLNEVIPCRVNRDKADRYENLDPYQELPISQIEQVLKELMSVLQYQGHTFPLSNQIAAAGELETLYDEFKETLADAGKRSGIHIK